MSHIIRFSVIGLAGSDKPLECDLNRDINIFFGLNGSGKTTLLKILNSALSTNADLLLNLPFKSAEVVLESVAYNTQFTYTFEGASSFRGSKRKGKLADTNELEFEVEEIGGEMQFRKKGMPQWKINPPLPKGIGGKWQHTFLPTNRLILGSLSPHATAEFDENFYDSMFAQDLARHWQAYFGSVQADVRAMQEKGIANILTEMLSTDESIKGSNQVNWEESYQRVSDFLKRQQPPGELPSKKMFHDRFRASPVLQRVVERIDSLEREILRAMEARTKLQILIERLFSGQKRLLLGGAAVEVLGKNDVNIKLQSLSSGEKQILRIMFAVLGAGVSSLIIDEPEISLHIDWQRELVKAIMELNPQVQLVAATHSPEIMALVQESKIFNIPS